MAFVVLVPGLILAMSTGPNALARLFSSSVPMLLGRLSYAIYLLHFPMFPPFRRVGGEVFGRVLPPFLAEAAALIVFYITLLAAAEIAFRCVESLAGQPSGGSATDTFDPARPHPHNPHWPVNRPESRVWFVRTTLKALQMIAYVCSLRWNGLGRRAITSLEYALIAAFVAIVIVSSVAALGTKLKVPFTTVSTTLAN